MSNYKFQVQKNTPRFRSVVYTVKFSHQKRNKSGTTLTWENFISDSRQVDISMHSNHSISVLWNFAVLRSYQRLHVLQWNDTLGKWHYDNTLLDSQMASFIYFKKSYFPFSPKMSYRFIKTENETTNDGRFVKFFIVRQNILIKKYNKGMFTAVCAAIQEKKLSQKIIGRQFIRKQLCSR